MNWAFLIFKYFPYGGLQRIFLDVVDTAVRRGHRIDIYTLGWEGPQPHGVDVRVIEVAPGANHKRYRRFHAAVCDLIAGKNYDCVVGFNKMPGLDVYYALDPCFEEKARTLRGPYYRFTPRYRHFSEYEHAVFAPDATTELIMISAAEIEHFVRHYGTPRERFHLLPPGVAHDRIRPADAERVRAEFRRANDLCDNDLLALLVGSDFTRKGLDRIIRALANLPAQVRARTQLFVLGRDDPAKFQRLAAQFKVANRIRFLGGVDDVPPCYIGADLLVHPARHENTGTVILEAIIAGLPVLVTANCGYAHLVTEADAGLVVPVPFEQPVFDRMFHESLVSPERERWQRNAIRYGRNLDLHGHMEVACDVIEQTSRRLRVGATN
jgi:UDP-glucose:(heptosyl)LPS alpha-1,3-glucosyltransferase